MHAKDFLVLIGGMGLTSGEYTQAIDTQGIEIVIEKVFL